MLNQSRRLQLVNQFINQSNNQTINQSINQSINQLVNRSINQSVNSVKAVVQSVSVPIALLQYKTPVLCFCQSRKFVSQQWPLKKKGPRHLRKFYSVYLNWLRQLLEEIAEFTWRHPWTCQTLTWQTYKIQTLHRGGLMERHTCLMIFIFIIYGGFSLYAVVTSIYAVTYSLYSVPSPLYVVLFVL